MALLSVEMFSMTSGGQAANMSLVEMCRKGDLEGVKAALKRGADVNAKGKYSWTGLIWAVEEGCQVFQLQSRTQRKQ